MYNFKLEGKGAPSTGSVERGLKPKIAQPKP
jgi:hypothetical protein